MEEGHTTAVVCLPGTGDEVQSQKAGLLEVGDCMVLNKADHPGADAAERALLELLHLRGAPADAWEPRLFKTVAVRGEGVPALLDRLRERVEDRILVGVETDPELRRVLDDVLAGDLDPYTAADQLIEKLWSQRDDA